MPRVGLARLKRGWLRLGLPAKLLLLTGVFVMLAEVLIFVPSIANYRVAWLQDRLATAQVAMLAAEAVPGGAVPPALRNELLRTALVRAVAVRRDGKRRLILPPVSELSVDSYYDLREPEEKGWLSQTSHRMGQIFDALAVFVADEDRVIRVIGYIGPRYEDIIEIVLPEAPLKRALLGHGLNILGLSILISMMTAALVYLALSSLIVRPIMRITRNMLHFSQNPEDPERIIKPSDRADEIGTTERELAQMQRQLSQLLLQKTRLAQLGLAVSKINHDLRNMLANAQLISDRLTSIPDPTVQRFAPKLIASLDRAISFCNDSLKFGRAEEATPRRELMRLRPLVEEVADSLGLPREGSIDWVVDIDETLRADVDREHIFRIMSNLVRNATQAIESQGEGVAGTVQVKAWREGRKVLAEVRDDGPGVPARARANLFKPFQGSTRKGGSGLGLAIAAELIAVHGGTIQLLDSDKGAAFLLELPDRATH